MLWLLVMPPLFFYFIGTVTGGFSSGLSGGQATPVTVVTESPGFLRDQVDLRLAANDFAAEWVESLEAVADEEAPSRTLTFDSGLSDKVLADEPVGISYETRATSLTRQFEEIRINRAQYTALADIIIADATLGPLNAGALTALNNTQRAWQLEVSPAGDRLDIPTGFQQAVPGILVMFTLLVLLTSSGTAPISKAEVIAGKWNARMIYP